MELQVINSSGEPAGNVTVADEAFGREFNQALVHQVLVAYWAGGRAGTKAQKTRSEVRGGGTKPWRQKGTGRARAGTIRSPIWRGGGVTFAAKPRNYAQKVNKKMYRAALRSIFSELVRQERLLVVDALGLDEPKTKQARALLDGLGVSGGALLVSDSIDDNLYLATRNLPYVDVSDAAGVNPDSLVRYDKIVITQAALTQIGERLA